MTCAEAVTPDAFIHAWMISNRFAAVGLEPLERVPNDAAPTQTAPRRSAVAASESVHDGVNGRLRIHHRVRSPNVRDPVRIGATNGRSTQGFGELHGVVLHQFQQ